MSLIFLPPTAMESERWLEWEPAYFQFLPDDILSYYREIDTSGTPEPRWRTTGGLPNIIIINLLARILMKLDEK